MSEVKFYIQRYTKNSQGKSWVKDGAERSLEDDFGFCRYKSLSNLNGYGKPKGVYTETYAEGNSARVWFSDNPSREQTQHELQVYFFGVAPEVSSDKSLTEQILKAEGDWHNFFEYLENHFLVWHDSLRQRKLLFEISDAPTIAKDVIKDIPYLQCTLKLTNVFGKTFAMDDTTIEDWLANGGKEAGL